MDGDGMALFLRYQSFLLFGINRDGLALEQILPAISKFLLFENIAQAS